MYGLDVVASCASVAHIKSAASSPALEAARLLEPLHLADFADELVIAHATNRQVRSRRTCSSGIPVLTRRSKTVAGSVWSSRSKVSCESEIHWTGTFGAPRK